MAVYISSDGSIGKEHPQRRNPLSAAINFLLASPKTGVVKVATIALIYSKSRSFYAFGPLSNGKIPAASRAPSEHWSFMANNVEFVRTMTEPLHRIQHREDTTNEGKKRRQEFELFESIEKVDFGGEDGHVAEHTDFMDLEGIRVTRCTTTRSAITAYMCGAEKATNVDVGRGSDGKLQNHSSNTSSFRKYLKCRYEQGVENGGNHRRSVFRLGIGNKDNMSGYAHAFSIIAQPDGSYYWLQSFIGHYSLATWLKKKDGSKLSGLAGVLTYEELIVKLDTLDRLMMIDGWTNESNNDYLDLFNVDKNLEKVNSKSTRNHRRWIPDHRLSVFTWDEACEYPLPEEYRLKGEPSDEDEDEADYGTYGDTCSEMMILNLFNDLEDLLGDLSSLE